MAQGFNLEFKISPETLQHFNRDLPQALQEGKRKAVEAAGMVWADETKELTRDENHIDTSLYINSIGHVTNIPATNKSGKGSRQATQNDVIHELNEGSNETILDIGSNVSYAEILEKRWSLMARGLDKATPRMQTVANFQIAKAIGER